MKYLVLLCISLVPAFGSCKKDKSSLSNTVFEGKYLGEGCFSVIKILKPSLNSIGLDSLENQWVRPLSPYHDTSYFSAVNAEVIPDEYKDGNVFYFTVTKITMTGHVMDCTAPKYFFVIKTISAKKPVENQQ